MKKFIFCIAILFSSTFSFSQITVSGNVLIDGVERPISDAIVYFVHANVTAVTDSAGYFSVVIPEYESPVVKHISFSEGLIRFVITKEYDAQGNEILINGNERKILIYLTPSNHIFFPVRISANTIVSNAPVTYTTIIGKQLNENNFGEDMPFLLESTPSTVVTSDAGNGVGYTGLRIRGSDATRVNITVNGVPYNDAESQQTYWVDLPDFASSVDEIQIQRGVGTSTNGISSFGAAVNINTNVLSRKPFVKLAYNTGSFNLSKKMIQFGTGLINDHWQLEGRYSDVYSDGYVDRAYADLNSYFITAAYQSLKYKSIINVFSGNEKTYQSWAGVPAEILDTNRTYNPYTYENQTDNYIQTHYQWHNIFNLNTADVLRITFNYTKGKGYYEQYESEQSFSDYGVDNVIVGSDTITSTDLITQKWLDSDFGGVFMQYENQLDDNNTLNFGGAYYLHAGDHFGNIIWSEYASTLPHNYEWYKNDALKQDANVFGQWIYKTQKINVLTDLQLRDVNYRFLGYDDEGIPVEQTVNLLFFNPKAGITFLHNNSFETYVFAGVSGKEPNRDDYVESSSQSRPSPEHLYNTEIGERIQFKGWQFSLNYYMMYYKNQLVLTGEINDVGAYTRTNIPSSYRTGIEVAWAKMFFTDKLTWESNFTISKNTIVEYTEYLDNWDTGEQTPITYNNSTIAFSPSTIVFNKLAYNILDITGVKYSNRITLSFTSKYVGEQYSDNSNSEERKLDAYLLHDAGLRYILSRKQGSSLAFNFNLQNVTNQLYESNAWVYRYIYENTASQLMGYYPQAGINWNAGITLSF